MRTIRLTAKLQSAIEILSDEHLADASEEAFMVALQKGKIKISTLYKILTMMRYKWSTYSKRWVWWPRQEMLVIKTFTAVQTLDNEELESNKW